MLGKLAGNVVKQIDDTLSNGLKLSVFELKNNDTSYASISFNRGHFDATHLPQGTAHLLEHLLFSNGTSNKDLTETINGHNGEINAYTKDTETNVYFHCEHSGFVESLSNVVKAITAPSFDESAIRREIAAIESEFQSKRKDQSRRFLSVLKHIANKNHPFAYFSAGNKQTLTKSNIAQTKADLEQLHRQLCDAKNTSICIATSKANLDQTVNSIVKLLESSFSNRTSLLTQQYPADLLDARVFNKLIEIENIHPYHQLLVNYIFDNREKNDINLPLITICHIIESKHKRGLFCHLLEQNLVFEIQCFYKILAANHYELSIALNLTDTGYDNVEAVISLVRSFVGFLCKNGIEAWRLREKQIQNKIHLSTGAPEDPLSTVIEIAETRHLLNLEKVVQVTHFDLNDVKRLSDKLLNTIEYCDPVFYLISPDTKGEFTTPHYDVNYALSPLNFAIKQQTYSFTMPRQNPFLGYKNEVIKAEFANNTVHEMSSNGCCLKFYQELSFASPKAESYVSITDRHMFGSAQNTVIKKLWLSCLSEQLDIEFFDTDLAGLHHRVYSHHHGICIHTSGLSERQLLLMIEIINFVLNFKANRKSIERHLEINTKRRKSRTTSKAINKLFNHLNEKYADKKRLGLSIDEAVKTVTIEDVVKTQSQYFKSNFIECLCIGNWQQSGIQRFFKQLTNRFKNDNNTIKPNENNVAIHPTIHQHFQLNEKNEHNVIFHLIPCYDATTCYATLSARSLILEKIFSVMAFGVFRQQQIAYVAGAGYKPLGGYPGVALYVSSNTHSIEKITSAMRQLFDEACENIAQTPDAIDKLKTNLVKQIKPHETDLNQTATRAWMNFEADDPLNEYKKELKAVNDLTAESVIECIGSIGKCSIGQTLYTQNDQFSAETAFFFDDM